VESGPNPLVSVTAQTDLGRAFFRGYFANNAQASNTLKGIDMAKKEKPTSSSFDNNKTQIILAIIGLISTLTVAYLGYRQIIDPIRMTTRSTQTAEANLASIPSTPTDNIVPTLEPSATITAEALQPTFTFTPTATPVIAANCLSSDTWYYTPPKLIPTDGCWLEPNFAPVNNGIQIGRVTELNSGEQQRGFYTVLAGNADIQFVVKINKFESLKTSTDKTRISNLAFGIVEGSPFNYFNGIYVYYYGSKPDVGRFESQVTKEQDVAYNGALNSGRTQTIRFRIEGKSLTVYVDGVAVETYTLTFKQNAFYFGYRLFEQTDLNASMSDISINTP